MQIQPVRKYLAVRIHDANVTGLHLPEGAKIQPYAEVIRVGKEVTTCAIGDRVAFLPNCGPIAFDEFQPDGTKVVVWVIHEDVILGTLTKEDVIVPMS